MGGYSEPRKAETIARRGRAKQKYNEATRMLADLFIHRNSMAPSISSPGSSRYTSSTQYQARSLPKGTGRYLEQMVKDMSHGS